MIGSLTPQCRMVLAFNAPSDVAFRISYNVSHLIVNLSRLNRITTLLARCLRLTPIITDDSSRLTTVGWLNLIQTGFPPVRLIALGWAHNSKFLFPIKLIYQNLPNCQTTIYRTVYHKKIPYSICFPSYGSTCEF